MDFIKKNDFVVKNKSLDHFDKDLELFKAHCPSSRLHSDLKRTNSFNKRILDGHMLFELLEKVSTEEILENRKGKPTKSEKKPEDPVAKSVTDVIVIFTEQGIPELTFTDDQYATLVGKPVDFIKEFVKIGLEFGTIKLESDENIDTGTGETVTEDKESPAGDNVGSGTGDSDPAEKTDSENGASGTDKTGTGFESGGGSDTGDVVSDVSEKEPPEDSTDELKAKEATVKATAKATTTKKKASTKSSPK